MENLCDAARIAEVLVSPGFAILVLMVRPERAVGLVDRVECWHVEVRDVPAETDLLPIARTAGAVTVIVRTEAEVLEQTGECFLEVGALPTRSGAAILIPVTPLVCFSDGNCNAIAGFF